jgi:hypothetical protein
VPVCDRAGRHHGTSQQPQVAPLDVLHKRRDEARSSRAAAMKSYVEEEADEREDEPGG